MEEDDRMKHGRSCCLHPARPQAGRNFEKEERGDKCSSYWHGLHVNGRCGVHTARAHTLRVRLAQLSAAPALHALVLYIPVLHCALREIGSGSACHQRGAQEAGYSVLRPAPSQCIYREGAGAAESYAKHTLNSVL